MQKQEFWKEWFEDKSFTNRWVDAYLATWSEILRPHREKDAHILEIGSWEGRSAVFFLEFFRHSKIVCIDTFEGGDEHQTDFYKDNVDNLEKRFDANLSKYALRVEKIRSRSLPALDRLQLNERKFDVIYIDGSHRRDDVLIDSTLCWQMLNDGGILIWDDYIWNADGPPSERPQPAIDAFLDLHKEEYLERAIGKQIIVEKKKAETDDRGSLENYATLRPVPRTLKNLYRFFRREPIY